MEKSKRNLWQVEAAMQYETMDNPESIWLKVQELVQHL